MRLNQQMLRFAAVGIANTLIDVPLFLLLRSTGLSVWVANILSTSVALTFSFLINRQYTFKSSGRKSQQIVPFLAVTITGLWLLQPLVIKLFMALDNALGYTEIFYSLSPIELNYKDLVPKLISIVFTMIWNYVWYSKTIFREKHEKDTESA